ncbi:Oidioi.mRNA.OKI2018_I69.XSR.g14131.t2.cds [Oikopleura dioica]|uniref:Oidioi.mRNA.OKI2018_I69.XSR.g14131.t2.cds n=1 Tax=Oikopleura dioica TaxID=34765 RepID=A0ABN7SDS1_OIKDI|nr:Oidioi.mRNA.OKI2018_I69.XSR.g14131.t2.cds [Oikopleura dioica]
MIKNKRKAAIVLKKNNEERKDDEQNANKSDSDSESEESLMERLFGKKMKQSVVSTASSEVIDSDNEETSETPVKTVQEQTPPTVDEDEEDCVWHDEDDDVERKKVAEMKFAEFSGAWLNVKPVAEDEENFSGKIFSKRRGVLPQGEIDIEEVGTLVIGGLGGLPISGFDFHPHAPAAMLTQADTLAMFKIDGRENPLLQAIRLDNFHIKCARIISRNECLATSHVQWFYSHDLESGAITRTPFIKGRDRKHRVEQFYTSYESKYLAFTSRDGPIHIVSKKNKEVVGVLQSATEQNVDVKMSKDGNRMWTLSECGQVMTFDLRKMEPVHSFQDMAGCTSLGVNDQETIFSIGSTSGLINLYDETCMTKEYPDCLKTLKNLRAPVTFQKFNSTGELGIFGSELLPDQARLLHCHSQR